MVCRHFRIVAMEQAMQQPLFPVPLQICPQPVPQMPDHCQTNQDSGNNAQLLQAGSPEKVLISRDCAVDNISASQRKPNAKKSMPYLGCSHDQNRRETILDLLYNPK